MTHGNHWEKDAQGDELFDLHLQCLQRMMSAAEKHGLRFKLSKCWFCQWVVSSLGKVAGVGTVAPAEKQVQGILTFPRPTRHEDLERYLALMVFIKQHLSPRLSHVTKPLRDALAVLQQKRADKRKMKSSRPPPSIRSDRQHSQVSVPAKPQSADETNASWPAWWTSEMEAAFVESQKIVASGVMLGVPDFRGAADGSNPFRIHVDACAYGVGAGIFQLPAANSTDGGDDYYTVLKVPKGATKQEIDFSFASMRRKI